MKSRIKSTNAVKVISEKETVSTFIYLDLENSQRAAYRLLQDIKDDLKAEDDKVMSIIARWINFEKYFEYEFKPSL